MLPRTDLPSVRPVGYVEASTKAGASADARQEIFQRLTQINLGKQFQAAVMSRLDDGTFLVRIAGTTARMTLPAGTKVGDSMPMTLVETAPRMTFLLGADAADGAAPATLSSGARLIDRLLQAAQDSNLSTAVAGKNPITSSPRTATPQVAAALHDTVSQSGLFYESHVNQWANGNRPLATLLREPQAQGSSEFARANAGIASPQLLTLVRDWTDSGRAITDLTRELQTRSTQNLPVASNSQQNPAQVLSAQLSNQLQQWAASGRSLQELVQTANMTLSGDAAMRSDLSNPQAAQLINAQLHTLEQNRVIWHGELWPGQKMEWEVSKDTPNPEQPEAQQDNWQSTVRFELPTLGTIAATIHLTGGRVSVNLRTTTETAAASLREHTNTLADALAAAGSPLDFLNVKQDEKI